jgi:hypothetical protein
VALCWICVHGKASTDPDPVGCCKSCGIFACDSHSDRLSLAEFWCYVCLQKAALDQATGRITYTDESLTEEDVDRVIGSRAIHDLWSEIRDLVSDAFVEDVINRTEPLPVGVQVPFPFFTQRLQFGTALMSACLGGTQWIRDPSSNEAEFVNAWGHPILRIVMGMGLPMAPA